METYHWDVVCACSEAKLNELLAAQFTQTPASLHYEDDGTTIDADFEPWRLIGGGANKKLHLELPIAKGKVTTPMGEVALDGVVPVVEVELSFVKDEAKKQTDLRFDLAVVGEEAGDPTPGSVFVVNPDKTGKLAKSDPGGVAKMSLHDDLAKCLVANREKLAYVFTTLNLTPAGAASWLAPHHPAYLYVQGKSDAPGYLAVLSVLSEATDTSKFELKIDPSLCDGKHDVCVAFSKTIFLDHVVRPGLKDAYPGSGDATFGMAGDRIQSRAAFHIPRVKSGLVWYYPVIDSLSVRVAASQITAHAVGQFDITGLLDSYVTFDVQSSANCTYDAAKGRLALTKSGDPHVNSEKHIPWYTYVLALPALAVIPGLLGAIIAAVVDGVIAAVVEGVQGDIDQHNKGQTGNMALGDWAAQAIEWPGSDRWTVAGAELSDAFALRCNLIEKK